MVEWTRTLEDDRMIGMAKKKKAEAGSRHLDRHMVSLPGDIYEAMKALADRESRPLRMQVILACKEHLASRGLWPPPGRSPEGGAS
jgi:hypothetical protein